MNKYEQCAKMFFRPVLTFVRFCSFFDFKSCINNYISDVKDSLQNEIQIYKTTERQLSKEKDEQLKRTNEEIRQKIMQLEKLSHTKDELEKNLLTLRSENSNLKKREQAVMSKE